MIKFFRDKAKWIGWIIVITFGATIFTTGSYFFSNQGEDVEQNKQNASLQNALALWGEDPITPRQFQIAYRGMVDQLDFSKTGGYLSPDLNEIVQFNAFNQTVRNMILVKGAKAEGIKVSKGELNNNLFTVYANNGFKGKRDLKKRLKEINYPYELFIDNFKNNIIVSRFTKDLMSKVLVSNQDVDNLFVKVNVQHILIRLKNPENLDQKERYSQDVYDKILSNELTFEEAVTRFSDDSGSSENEGSLGWISVNSVVPELEEVAFSLSVGEISRPIKTVFGFHIVKVNDRQDLEKPKNIDYEKEKQKILEARQQRVVDTYIQDRLSQHELIINLPSLKAYKAKVDGDYNTALGQYQLLISRDPYSAVPHYMRGKIFQMIEDEDNAILEFNKAEIKADLNQDNAFPELYMSLAALYKGKKKNKQMLESYDKAFNVAKNNPLLLEELKSVYSDLNDNDRVASVETELLRIETEKEEERKKQEALESDLGEYGVTPNSTNNTSE